MGGGRGFRGGGSVQICKSLAKLCLHLWECLSLEIVLRSTARQEEVKKEIESSKDANQLFTYWDITGQEKQ